MAEEIPELYRSLKKTEKTKPVFKREYNQIRQRLIAEGKFKSTDKGLNPAILNEMGEFPYWKRGRSNPNPVPLGEGEYHQMSGGEARPFSARKASQSKASKIRQDRLKKANELMTTFGLEDEVELGKSKFDKSTKTPKGMAWDHIWEVQDFGSKYEKLIEEFASGSINEKQFKSRLKDHIKKNPGDIQRNLELKPQSENLAKEASTRAVLKEEALADAYAVKDAKYTKFQKLDDVTKAAKLDKAHKTAVNLAGDLYIDDITDKSKVFSPKINRGKLIKLGVAGVVLPAAGSVANTLEAAERAKIAAETNNRLDVFQSWLSNAELTTGLIPAGEIVSTPLGVANLVIDAARYGTQPTDTSSRQRYRHGNR